MTLWRCPLCLCRRYRPIIVQKPSGGEYQTEFFECERCTNMFRNPERYARLGIPMQRATGDVGPKTLAEAQHFWREDLERKD